MTRTTFIRIAAPLLAAGLCTTAPANAQAPAPEADSYTYGTYFYCDVTQQDRVDEIAAKLNKPIYDAGVADGSITAWGWLAHHTGGKWRRADYVMAPSLPALLSASEKFNDQAEAKNKAMNDEMGKICNSHDDYIWKRVAGFSGAGPRGNASFSTYHVCDMSREKQADALVKQYLAPIYDKLVADGKLISWSWMEHIVGGEYRRLEVITAKDVPSLMAARSSLVEAMDMNPVSDVVSDICNSHADYIWEIKLSK